MILKQSVFVLFLLTGCAAREKISDRNKLDIDIQKNFSNKRGNLKANVNDNDEDQKYANKLQDYDTILHEVIATIHKQEAKINQLEARDQQHETEILELKARLQQYEGVYMTFACNLDVISLSCPSNRTINVTSAYYAQHIKTCSDACGLPHPEDCKESMAENAPVDWYALTTVCNNQTSCEMENPGRDVASCEEPYHSNYALIYFACLPDDAIEPSAFTASIDSNHEYVVGDVVIFDLIITNIGNNYLPETSTYVCPHHGLYMFSLTVFNLVNSLMSADIMCGDKSLATGYSTNSEHNQGTVTVLTECAAGEQVWVRNVIGNGNQAHGRSLYKYNLFLGVLLQPFREE